MLSGVNTGLLSKSDPGCVYVSLVRFATSISYDSSVSTLSPVRMQIPAPLLSGHKQKHPKKCIYINAALM